MDKLTPYSVTMGRDYFDWNKFLAREPSTILEEEFGATIELAREWPTCACGNQCSLIPRYSRHEEEFCAEGEPKDRKLAFLGLSFFNAIKLARDARYFDSARCIMAKIEQRSAEILMEMGRREL